MEPVPVCVIVAYPGRVARPTPAWAPRNPVLPPDAARPVRSDLLELANGRCFYRSVGVARSICLRLPDDARLWRAGTEFALADRARLAAMFGTP